jgi:hypothetical protein
MKIKEIDAGEQYSASSMTEKSDHKRKKSMAYSCGQLVNYMKLYFCRSNRRENKKWRKVYT